MNTIYRFTLFCIPFIGKYWWRFSVGIILGFLFGASNGFTLGSVSILLQRLTLPDHVQAITDAGIDAAKDQKSSKTKSEWGNLATRAEQIVYVGIDPWLPLWGRALDWKQCLGLFLMFPLLALIRGMLGYGSTYLLAWVGQRITNDVKLLAFKKMCSLSPEYFTRTPMVLLLNRLENDSSGIRTFLLMGLTDMIQQPFTLISLFLTMFYIDPGLTTVALIFIPLFVVPTQLVGKKIKKMGKMDNVMMVAQSAMAVETFNNIRITKAYCLEKAHIKIFDKAGQRVTHYAMKLLQSREMLGPVLETVSMMGVSFIFLYVVSNGGSVDTLGTFMFAMMMFFVPIKRLSALNVYFLVLNQSAERLMEIFSLTPSVPESKNPVPFKSFQREIRLKEVSLAYKAAPATHQLKDKTASEAETTESQKAEKVAAQGVMIPVLNKLSFTIPRGYRLGLAGESGAGKSSLLLLLLRFWDPTEGALEIDGINVKDMSFEDLRSQIAYVTQEVQLFDETIGENIRFGKLSATQDEIILAAKRAHAHDFISSLPAGYNTRVGERGVMLSGGQRQRVAIARAFVRNAPILILDEATASLDSQSEAEVQKAIDDLTENRTVVCVAHRLSTLKNMDEILVLKKGGDIGERGSFKELLERGGMFTQMAAAQSIFATSVTSVTLDPLNADQHDQRDAGPIECLPA